MTTTPLRVKWDKPFVRFILLGGTNTLATGLLVALLSLIIPGWIAFTIAFIIGLIFSVALTGRWVFKSETNWSKASLFAFAYLLIYLCGLFLVQVLEFFGLPPVFNGATVFVTAPLGFVAGKYVFRNERTKRKSNDQVFPSP